MKNKKTFLFIGLLGMALMAAVVAFFLYTVVQWEFHGCFTSVVFSNDGRRMLTRVGGGNLIMLWDVETGREIRTITGANADHLAIGPDGQQAVTGGNNNVNGLIVLWNLDTGQPLHVFEGPLVSHLPMADTCVDFSPDGKYLISAELEKDIILWDARTYEKVRVFQTEDQPAGISKGLIHSITFSPDGRWALTAGERLILWEVETGRISRVFKDYGDDVHNVHHHALITSDGRLVVSGGRDNNLSVWSLESGKELQSVPLEYIPRAVSFSPDGRLAVTENPYRPGALEVWDTGTGALSLALQASPGSEGLTEISFAVIPDGTMVATGLCGWIEFRDIRTGKIVKTIKPARGLIQILVDTIWKYVRI